MIGSRSWFALMRRNGIYRKRYWISGLVELISPVFCLYMLILIKGAFEKGDELDSEIVPPTFPGETNLTFTPFTFRDYLTALRAKRVCVIDKNGGGNPFGPPPTSSSSGSSNSSNSSPPSFTITGYLLGDYNWQVPLLKCDSRECTEPGQDAISTVCEYNIIGVAGNDGMMTIKFVQWLEATYPDIGSVLPPNANFTLIKSFGSSQDMDSYVTSPNYGNYPMYPKLAMGIVFESAFDEINTTFKYTLRQNGTNFNNPEQEGRPATWTTPLTSQLTNEFAKNYSSSCKRIDGTPMLGPFQDSCVGQYMYNGILTFQRLVQDFVLELSGSNYMVSEASVQYAPFPTLEYKKAGFYATLLEFGPIIITLGLLDPVAVMISYVVQEKELRQKELLKMMGVSESDINWAWFTNFFILYGIISAALVAFISDVLFEESIFELFWIFWILTYTNIITFCMTVASLTSKSIRGVLIGIVFFFCGVFLMNAIPLDDPNTTSSSTIGIVSIHPVAALSYGLANIGLLEDNGMGLKWDTINLAVGNRAGYTFVNTIQSLLFNCLFWGFWVWYLNRVIVPDYGQAYPFYFPFTKSYWFPNRLNANQSDDNNDDDESQNFARAIPYEPVGEVLRRQKEEGTSIEIHNLRKTFGEKTAVDDLSLSMYSGQITALLGHNGAGKTTTISILTGAMAASSGYATILGKDTRTQMQAIRQDIGICLQHDCLFPMLTVREHVQFFARLKGLYSKMSYDEAEAQIDQAIRDVALFEKRNTYSKSLSGGMKRKLSVAMAFSGGSKVVLLDEPTSGMDPFSRRFTWNVIRQYRQDRIIILTTHFMDEADILGDRIAIMAAGQLRCAGSSLFLKKTYGVGYQLTIEKSQESHFQEIQQQQTKMLSDREEAEKPDDGNIDEKLSIIVKLAVPEASLLNNTGSEIRYQLPMGAAPNFPPMFQGLDAESDVGSIQSYGISMTTLDEVFLLVARGESHDHPTLKSSRRILEEEVDGGNTAALDNKSDRSESTRSRMDLNKEGLFFRHLVALTRKRAANFKRDKKAWFFTTLAPVAAVFFGLILVTFFGAVRNLEPITLSLGDLNKDVKQPPINPVWYNSPSDPFLCQPGQCSYVPIVLSNETNEAYGFCGYVTRPINSVNLSEFEWENNNKCSILISAFVMNETNSNVTTKVMTVDTVLESSQALYATSDDFAATQYGAILFTHDRSSIIEETGANFVNTAIEQCQITSSLANYTNPLDCSRYGGIGYVIQFNFTSLHAGPMFQALADETLIRQGTNNDKFQIQLTIAPLPLTKFESGLAEAEDSFMLWLLVVCSFPVVAGAFGSFIVAERESKAKHLQTVAGVEPSAYWISSFIWDTLNYQIPLWLTIALFFAFDMDLLTTTTRNTFSGICAILFLYGPAAAGFTYCTTFLFTSPSACALVSIVSGFIIGMGGPLAIFIITLIATDSDNENLPTIATTLTWILRLHPSFCLGKGIFWVLNIDTILFLESDFDLSAWSEPVLLLEVIFLFGQSIVYLSLAIMLDRWSTNPSAVAFWQYLFCKCSKANQQAQQDTPVDSDVLQEEERVLSGRANSDLIVLSQLAKVYGNGKVAVDNVSLGIPHGECFGLLGINGAGKTTTMAMLTAEFPPTSGDATLAGYSVSREPQKTRRRIGYCPQFDAHFANMTGREHVELYASIKGVPKEFVKEAVNEKLREVGLSDFDSDRLCSNYSGGMKRRLSLAIATIGKPEIVFLDECSTGVDPVARREIWEMISAMVSDETVPKDQRTAVILTTHSMEECEALCPRIGIMANGKLRCLGSAQRLKNKFGQGYQVELKTDVVNDDDEDYKQNVETLASSKGVSYEQTDDVLFNLDETTRALEALTSDGFLSSMITSENEIGYSIFRDATSPVGVTLSALAAFATSELRMRNVEHFLQARFPDHVLRERQDSKARYEVSNKNTRLSDIFASVEECKHQLRLSDYGVSQTSLEQVFNMHAAEAEKFKQGRNDH